jgi:hypothetical protein
MSKDLPAYINASHEPDTFGLMQLGKRKPTMKKRIIPGDVRMIAIDEDWDMLGTK